MVTRRQFLIGAGTALLAAAGCSRTQPAPAPAPVVQAAAAPEPRPFRLALLSDTHAQEAGSVQAVAVNGKIARAVADLKEFKPDLWLCNGDVSDHGLPGEFAAFRKILLGVAKPEELVVTTGNHEFYDKDASDELALARFREAFGLSQPHSSKVAGGIHIVMLADEQWKTAPRNREWAWVTPEQLRWFEAVLQEHRQKFTVVCMHQPLQETVLWTGGGNDFGGCGQVAELRGILKQNPQVKLWLSGHTHLRVEAEGQVVKQAGVTYAGLGSTFYQFLSSDAPEDQGGWPAAGGFRKDLSASQSRMLDIWPDRVVLRARDHVKHAWLDDQEIVINRT